MLHIHIHIQMPLHCRGIDFFFFFIIYCYRYLLFSELFMQIIRFQSEFNLSVEAKGHEENGNKVYF